MFLQRVLKLYGVNVAFEGHFKLCVLGLVNGAVECNGFPSLDVSFRCVEVGVAGHDVAGVYKVREEYVLGGASLVGGDEILEAREPLDRFFQLEERVGAGVAFVAGHDASPLAVAHGACS